MTTGTGAVYDRSYRPYDGARGSRRTALLALYRASLRRAVGLRRPWRQKLAPVGLLLLAALPAVIQVGAGFLTRNTPASGFMFITYREYVGVSSVLLLFVALVGPDLVCPDRRQRVLPLLLARPLTGRDYIVVKVAALITCVFAFSVLPQVLLFVGQAVVSNEFVGYTRDHAAVLWQVPAAAAVLAVFYGVLAIAVSSVTDRRVVAGASLLVVTLLSATVSGVLVESAGGSQPGFGGHPAALLNIIGLPLQIRDLIFLGKLGPDSKLVGVSGGAWLAVICYATIMLGGLAVALRRYRASD